MRFLRRGDHFHRIKAVEICPGFQTNDCGARQTLPVRWQPRLPVGSSGLLRRKIIVIVAAPVRLRHKREVIDEVIARHRLRLKGQHALKPVKMQPGDVCDAQTAGRVHDNYLFALGVAVSPPPGNPDQCGIRLLLGAHYGPMIPHAFRPRFLCHAVSDFVQGKRRSRTHHGE